MVNYDKLPELTSNESTLLIKFIEFADKNELTRVDARNIHTNTKEFGIRPLILRATFQNLCYKSVLLLSRERDENALEDPSYYEINPSYADDIDAYFEFMTSGKKLPPLEIPAADRFVSIDDNQHPVVEAKEALIKLSKAIEDANELVANPEDQIRLSKEVDYINELISQPRIHISAVWDATKNNATLRWLMEQTASGIVRNLAVKAFDHLDKLLTILANLKP